MSSRRSKHRRKSRGGRIWVGVAIGLAAGSATLLLDRAPSGFPADDGGPSAKLGASYSSPIAFVSSAFAKNGNGNGGGNGNGNGGGNGNGNAGGNGNGNAGGNGNGNAGGNANANGNANGSANSNAGGLGKAKSKTDSDTTDADDATSTTTSTGVTTAAGESTAGHDVTPNEVLAIDADETSIDRLRELGFSLIDQRDLPALGFSLLRLRTPGNLDSFHGLALLRAALPGVTADVNALYQPYQGQGGATAQTELASLPSNDYGLRMVGWPHASFCGAGQRIGLIDTKISVHPPVLVADRVHQHSFVDDGQADGDTRHGTAIASLLVGQAGNAGDPEWHGLLPAADLYAASVFERQGDRPVASAVAIAEALDWLVAEHVPVVNISLSGEANLLMEAAVRRTAEHGTIMVAAAGNFGPSAPPSFPGAYPGVLAVTAVDQDMSVFSGANQGNYITFAAPGVRIWVPGGGDFGQYLTGTSFAAPFVAATATLALSQNSSESPAEVGRQLAAQSEHLGPPGRNPIFGYGLIRASSTCHASSASAL